MAKKARIQRWGNSNAIRLPHEFLEELQLGSNDEIVISVEAGSIVITRPPPSLRTLVDSMGKQQFSELDSGEDLGKEEIDD